MKVEKFFPYDVFAGGLFGINSFIFLVIILITICSLYVWEFMLIFRSAVISKSETT